MSPVEVVEENKGNFAPYKMVSGWAAPSVGLPKHLANEPTVTCVFPHKVSVQLDDGAGLVTFNPGIQEVPTSLATEYPKTGMHWYLKQNGVTRYEKPEEPMPEITDRHVEFLRSQGHNVTTVEGVRRFVESLDSEKRRTFFAAAAWQPEPIPVKETKPASVPTTPVNLDAMTKAQIVEHAAEAHGLDLDHGDSKANLIEAVNAAASGKK